MKLKEPASRAHRETAIVIGGGVSGLLAARELAQKGIKVTIVEQNGHLGGAVGAHQVAGLVLDSGAESFATRTNAVADLVESLGLKDKMVQPHSGGSWLYLPQGARRSPSTGILGIPGDLSDPLLKGIIGKSGVRRAKLDKFLPASAGENAKTLGELVRTRMGHQVLDNLVAPIVSGVHSLHPDQLEVDAISPGLRAGIAKYGSLAASAAALRKAAPAGSQVAGLVGGMNQLSEALVDDLFKRRVRVVTSCDVIAVDRDPISNDWTVIQKQTAWGEKAASIHGKYLVIATDAATCSGLLGPHLPNGVIPQLPASPEIALVTLVVDQPALDSRPRGTGLLVSQDVSTVRAKALTHATAKWDWIAEKAGAGRHVVRLSYGRGKDTSPLSEVALYDDQLVTLALHDASKLLDVSISRSNLIGSDVVRWNSAIPTVSPGHRERVATFRDKLRDLDGVTAVGAWLSGTGIAAITADTPKVIDEFIDRHQS